MFKRSIMIVEQLSFLSDKPITAGKTLLILDEIQSCPEAISSLKYNRCQCIFGHITLIQRIQGGTCRELYSTVANS